MGIKNSKETILNQAIVIFGKLGFQKTTMADIADASQKGRRTINTYFKNKEEVYEAVVEREIDKVVNTLKAEVANTDQTDEKFSRYLNLRIRSIIQLTQKYDALKVAFLNNYRWVEKIREKLDQEEQQILTHLFQNATKFNSLFTDNIDTTVRNITLTIKGIELMLIKEDDEETTSIQIKNLQQLLLQGLFSRKQES